MGKFKKETFWYYGKKVNWMGYKKTGSYGMYCEQVRHYWFGVYGIIGLRRTVSWGSSW